MGYAEMLNEGQDVLREKIRANAEERDGGVIRDRILIWECVIFIVLSRKLIKNYNNSI